MLLSTKASKAEPEQTKIRLLYSEAPGLSRCPGEQTVRREVEVRVGYDPFSADARDVVSVALAERDDDVVTTIEFRDNTGRLEKRREFAVPKSECSCWSLTSYAAVWIAFTLTRFGHPPSLRPAPPPLCPSAPMPVPVPSPPAPAASARLDLGVLGAYGTARIPLVGPSWALGLRWTSFSVALEQHALASTTRRADRLGWFHMTVLGAELLACLHWRSVFVCPLVDVEQEQLLFLVMVQLNRARLGVGSGLRLGAELPLGRRVALTAHAEAVALGMVSLGSSVASSQGDALLRLSGYVGLDAVTTF